MDVSISIVNYKSSDLIRSAIESIQNYTLGISYEIIITNNSPDDIGFYSLKDDYQSVNIKLIDLYSNIGFSKANNIAYQAAQGKYFLVYNPDLFLIENTIKLCFDFLEHNSEYVCCTVKFKYPNGQDQESAFYKQKGATIFYNHIPYITSVFKWKKKRPQIVTPHSNEPLVKIEVVCGAFLFISSKTYARIHGFDDDFFLYGEDWEISNRIGSQGLIALLNSTYVIHMHGGSSEIEFADVNQDIDLSTRKGTQMFVSILLWQKKEFGKIECFKLYILIITGFILAVFSFVCKGLYRKSKFQYLKNFFWNCCIITREVCAMLLDKKKVYRTM